MRPGGHRRRARRGSAGPSGAADQGGRLADRTDTVSPAVPGGRAAARRKSTGCWAKSTASPAGSEVTPPECAPLPMLAPTEGRRAGNRRRERRPARSSQSSGRCPRCAQGSAQLAECPSFTSTMAGDAGDVSEGDGRICRPRRRWTPMTATRSTRRSTSESSEEPDTRTLTLVALVEDVRVTASWQQQRIVGRLAGHPGAGHAVHRRGAQGAPRDPALSPSYPVALSSTAATALARWPPAVGRRHRGSGHDDIAIRFPTQPTRRADRGAARRAGLRSREVPRSGDHRPRRVGLRYARGPFARAGRNDRPPRRGRRGGDDPTPRSRSSSTQRAPAAGCATTNTGHFATRCRASWPLTRSSCSTSTSWTRSAGDGRWHCLDGSWGTVDDPSASPLAMAAVLDGRTALRPPRRPAEGHRRHRCGRERGAGRRDPRARPTPRPTRRVPSRTPWQRRRGRQPGRELPTP